MCQVYIRFAPVTVGCQVLVKSKNCRGVLHTPVWKVWIFGRMQYAPTNKNLSALSGLVKKLMAIS